MSSQPMWAAASFAQRRLWFLENLGVGFAYNIADAWRVRGSLDSNSLDQALLAVGKRHESLRTTFAYRNGEVIQLIHPVPQFESSRVSVSDDDSFELRAAEIAAEEREARFDLARGPLLRATTIQLGQDDCVLVFAMHHLITDAVSAEIFNDELSNAYDAITSRRELAFPDLPVQYADFAEWQRESFDRRRDSLLQYWRDALRDYSELQVPTDTPRPRIPRFRGGEVAFRLSAGVSAR